MILTSPIKTGYIANRQAALKSKRGPIAEFFWWITHGIACMDPERDWHMYRDGLEEQLQGRDPSQPSDWKSQRHFEISQKITKIINKEAWQFKTDYTYYPDDPYYIMGELEVGDLSEVEILMDIEKAYKIKFPKKMGEIIADNLTFEGLIDLVIELSDC